MMVAVLNLVVRAESPCFRQQVEGLTGFGVESTTEKVPKPNGSGQRGIRHYARFQLSVLAHARESYDIVHANYGLTAPAALAQPHRPTVLSLWGSDLMGEYGWVSRRLAPHFDAVVVMSEGMADELDTPCRVIPHGVDLELFAPQDRDLARDRLGWDREAKHVLFPYSPERTVKDYPRAERLVDRAAERLSEPVELKHVTGVDHERMPLYMNAADVLLLASRREGSPNVVKEACACNLPVVSTDVGDVRSLLADVSPSTVSNDDSTLVEGLCSIVSQRERSNGRDAVNHLSKQRMAKQLLEVYRDVLDDADAVSERPTGTLSKGTLPRSE